MINMLAEDQQLEVKKQAIEQRVKKYAIPRNPKIDDSVIALDCFPKSPSKKLALLVLAYKREATVEELKRISDQPAGLIRYPMTYGDLIDKLKNRYADFKPDRRFHLIKKELEDQQKYGERFYKVNYLDVIGKKGSQKKFYSQEILKEFDKHYMKRKSIEQ